MERSTSIGVLVGGALGALGAIGCAAASAINILLAPISVLIWVAIVSVAAGGAKRRVELVLSLIFGALTVASGVVACLRDL